MGAWGSGPIANDAAADWIADNVGNLVAPRVMKTLLNVNSDYNEVRAACWTLAKLGVNCVWPYDEIGAHLQLGVECLQRIQADEAWLSDYQVIRPNIERSLAKQIEALQTLIDTQGCTEDSA